MPQATINHEYPPIDWLWAAVLERKMVYGHDLKTMAKIAGVSYTTMRDYITRSPWTWKYDARLRICRAYDIEPVQSVRLGRVYGDTRDGVIQ